MTPGFPRPVWLGREGVYRVMVLESLGPSLHKLSLQSSNSFSLSRVAKIRLQLVSLNLKGSLVCGLTHWNRYLASSTFTHATPFIETSNRTIFWQASEMSRMLSSSSISASHKGTAIHHLISTFQCKKIFISLAHLHSLPSIVILACSWVIAMISSPLHSLSSSFIMARYHGLSQTAKVPCSWSYLTTSSNF